MRTNIISINRRRIQSDGTGVRTLVAFSGCPLHCKYCLNDFCHNPEKSKLMSVDEVYDEVMKDELYYKATNGGITFGGGEPLLHAKFIEELISKLPDMNFTIETSLYRPMLSWYRLIPLIKTWIIDVKDLNFNIYQKYCSDGTEIPKVNVNMVKCNLKMFKDYRGERENKVIIRVPHIPGYNTDADVEATKKWLSDNGFDNINEFEYITNEQRKENM